MMKPLFRSIQIMSCGLIFGLCSTSVAGLTEEADARYAQAQSRIELLKKNSADLKTQAAMAQALLIQNSQQMDLAAKDAAIRLDVPDLEKLMSEQHGECEIKSEGSGSFLITQVKRGEKVTIRVRFALNSTTKFPTFKRISNPSNAPLYEYEQLEWQPDTSRPIFYSAQIKSYKTQDSTTSEISSVVKSQFVGETIDNRPFGGFLQAAPNPVTPVSCVVE